MLHTLVGDAKAACNPWTYRYNQGDPGDSFDCILTGAISILEGDTEVAVLHRPATFGERALEEEGGKRTATCISKTGGVCARLSAATY